MRLQLMVVVLGSAIVAACGASPLATPTSGTAEASAGFVNNDDCYGERIALELAIEAYAAVTGGQPESESALLAGNFIDRDYEGIAVIDGVVAPVLDEACTERPKNSDQFTPECFDAALRLSIAASIYQLHGGVAPDNFGELSSIGLTLDSALYDLRDGVIVPTETGGCIPLRTASNVIAETCAVERKVLEVASEAFLAEYGVLPVDQAELVGAQFMRSEMQNFELDTSNGVVHIVPIGDLCATEV